MAPDYLARLMQQRSQARLIRFDEQVVHRATMGLLDPQLTGRYRTERSDTDNNVFLQKLAMIDEDQDGTLRPTVCGILLGSSSPSDVLSNSFIQAVAYRGTKDSAFDELQGYQLDQQDIIGPLDKQVEDSVRFVARNMKVAGSKHAGRTDVPQYDLTAVFEALVNAVAHRDYSMYGAKIRLRMYSDCLQICVPGSLANSMNVGTLPIRQSTRNEAITSLLARTPVNLAIDGFVSKRDFMMDRRGEGVNVIIDRTLKLSGRAPVYEIVDESELQLTIFAAQIDPIPIQKPTQTEGSTLEETT